MDVCKGQLLNNRLQELGCQSSTPYPPYANRRK
jgi:hypothetical protein